MQAPVYLCHYTNIDSLKFILRDKSFQFSSLEIVNDKREGFAKDFGDLRKYVFVNCWTDYLDEKVSLWKLYTKDMKGVRLKFKTPILKSFSPKRPEEYLFNNYIVFTQKQQLFQVKYTNDKIDLEPDVLTMSYYLDLKKIGKYKKTAWAYESEWRYILVISPLEPETKVNKNDFIARSSHLIKQRADLEFDKYFRPITHESFKSLEITLGPEADDNDRLLVEELIKIYNPDAKLFESSLKGDIR